MIRELEKRKAIYWDGFSDLEDIFNNY
jgi:hypothetical protein